MAKRMATTWEEGQAELARLQRQAQEHTARLYREESARRAQLKELLDIGGWEEVIETLAAAARDEYETSYRPIAKKLADDLDAIASELW